MKNTLLAVLVIALYYGHTQAQIISPHAPDYIKYQGPASNQSVGKEPITTNAVADGAATTDKLINDIVTSGKMADGVVTADKLADDIINSMKEMERALTAGRQTQGSLPVSLSPYNTVAINRHAYTSYMQNWLPYTGQSQKPRPTQNRIGWLPYQVH